MNADTWSRDSASSADRAALAGCRGLCERRLRLWRPYWMALAAARAVRAAAVLTYARGHYGYRASSAVVTRPVAMS